MEKKTVITEKTARCEDACIYFRVYNSLAPEPATDNPRVCDYDAENILRCVGEVWPSLGVCGLALAAIEKGAYHSSLSPSNYTIEDK